MRNFPLVDVLTLLQVAAAAPATEATALHSAQAAEDSALTVEPASVRTCLSHLHDTY
jgi:hypothetical protein